MGLVEVPGYIDEYDAYRSKLASLFGWVVVVNILTKIGKVKDREVEISCDNLSTLNRSFWDRVEDKSPSQPYFDILSGLHDIKQNMDTTWKYRHIAGHQEDVVGAMIEYYALLNIDCDIRAKGYWA